MATECSLNVVISSELKASEMHGDTPLLRSIELARRLQERGLSLPNPNLAEIIVSYLCFSQNTPSLWKLLDQAMASRLISPLQTLALLTQRVVPERRAQPGAYRLYLELLRRYALVLPPSGLKIPGADMIIKSINDSLHLSQSFGVEEMDFGRSIVFLNFTIINTLIDCTIEDCDLQYKNSEFSQNLHVNNTLLALEILEKITADKRVQVFLRLIYMNMPEKFKSLLDKIELIEAHLSNIISPTNVASNLIVNIQNSVNEAINRLEKHPQLGVLLNTRPKNSISNFCNNFGFGNISTSWIPIDVFLENAMDGRHLHVISAIEILTELIKTLQVINQATWHETFQALWISALRLVQRGRVQIEGPIPHLNARLCILLAIVPLAIALLVNNEENEIIIMKQGLLSSIQVLSQFSALLVPHPAFVITANEAATKAAVFVSNMKIGGVNPMIKAVGNFQHLIVEACIGRNLIDTSAYFWPNYIVPSQSLQKDSLLTRESPWSAFMNGAPLTTSLENALIATPAPSIAELEKLYVITLNGSDNEKTVASRILCGASLTCGWNFQEHVVRMVIKLLSPSYDSLESENGNKQYYIRNISMLNSILSAMSSVDTVHILSLYGLVPEVAAALMPICETFGSLAPPSNHKSCIPEETSVFSVFSYAFLLLLRLWKFYRPPQEHCIASRGAHVKHELTLDYLLLLRNSLVSLQNPNSNSKPVYLEFFPKLRDWYFQNQACISSTLSGSSNKNPVHQVANMIMNMVWINGSGLSNSTGGPVVSGRSGGTEDSSQSQRPTLPAWEVLEALPFVLEAALTACAYGQLSSRDLTTGLRHIVDFLPASLAVIVSYFSAEITRGIWKPVHLNGIDWPSPAANLLSIDQEIKDILASAGVVVPCIYPRGKEPMLPLPIAILVSLTITFKLDRNYDYIQGIIGQALENCASTSSWPSMPIVGALWTQKAKRWHDFIVLSCTRAPFSRDKHTVSQLIKSCFSSFLTSGPLSLLGHVDSGGRSPVAPGLLFIHSCRSFHDIHHVSEVIFQLIIDMAREAADDCVRDTGPRNGGSLASAMSKMRQVASLGASLLVSTGGVKLVQVLYGETFPTLLLLGKDARYSSKGPVHGILSGYAIAYLLLYSGVFVWGFGESSPGFTWVFSSRRARVFGRHVDFLTRVIEGNLDPPSCQPGAWKGYVLCFISLIVRFAPVWITEVKLETLRKLASGLKRWNECQLAIALLERAGPAAMSAVVESLS